MKRYFDHLNTLAAIKAEYKALVKANHPDVGGDTAIMQDINGQYAEAVKRIAKFGEGRDAEQARQEVPQEYTAAVAAAVNLAGVDLDLVGSWIWASGATYEHRAALKAAGYMFASKKRAWYWRPAWAAVEHSSGKSLEQIKEKYGAQRLSAAAQAPRMLSEPAKEKPAAKSAAKRKPSRRRRQPAGQVAMAI